MIKARAGNIIIFGLSKENISRLQKDDPIYFAADMLGPEFAGLKIAIIYGETEGIIQAELESVITKE